MMWTDFIWLTVASVATGFFIGMLVRKWASK